MVSFLSPHTGSLNAGSRLAVSRMLAAALLLAVSAFGQDPGAIQPSSAQPSYWQFRGKPILLLGASDDDSLFQWPAPLLEPHLDAMRKAGANYVRNTMSDRRDRGFELYAYLQREDGKYDLKQWNPEYWDRFERFLDWTAARDIVVQIEVWDRFDYSQERWPPHPYNPTNNVNYTQEESGLAAEYLKHPGANEQPFFFTTPDQRNNKLLLGYQQRFVDKMLSYSLKHNHVLYCMDNETRAEPAWGAYWAAYIKNRAKELGRRVYVTEMWDKWDIKGDEHRSTLDRPDFYDFADLSQNNQNKGEVHWENALWAREYVRSRPRPLNTVKTYGADGGKYGSTQDGLERFVRHVLAGFASARFHRPPAGIGMSDAALAAVRSVRKLEAAFALWESQPAMQLLSERDPNEAYAVSGPAGRYALYFPNGGAVKLGIPPGSYSIRWIDGSRGEWGQALGLSASAAPTEVTAPGPGHWLAVIEKR